MIRTEFTEVRDENPNGGKGFMGLKFLLTEAEMKDKCNMFSQVTLEPGAVLGVHEHHGESETYYIISGTGEYDDNGTKIPVKAGDLTYCPDGSIHGLANTGDTDLVFMALIISEK